MPPTSFSLQGHIPMLKNLPLDKWSSEYNVSVDAMTMYYDALSNHISLVWEYGSRLGVSTSQLKEHDKSKWTRHEYPFYADRFWGIKEHNAKFVSAMNHHLRCNMHHPEYWVSHMTYSIRPTIEYVEMPRKYVMEMIADWQAASVQYTGSDNIQDWLDRKLDKTKFHRNTLDLLKKELFDIGYYL